MAITWVGPNIVCVAADVKPTTVPVNTKLWETDTDKVFTFDGGQWLAEYTKGAYDWIVYKEGSNFYCADGNGHVSNINTNPATIIQYAIDNALNKKIYIDTADYIFPAGFTGISIPITGDEMTIICSPGAKFFVPNGYTGTAIKLIGTGVNIIYRTIWEGGRFNEIGSPARNWDCFRLEANEGPIFMTTVRDAWITNCNRAFYLTCPGPTFDYSWIHGCNFESNYIVSCRIGFDFLHSSTGAGINSNNFYNNIFQSSSMSSNGFKNITGFRNSFAFNKVWDLSAGVAPKLCMEFAASSHDNVVIGGIQAVAGYYQDNGTDNIVLDEWQKARIPYIQTSKIVPTRDGVTGVILIAQDDPALAASGIYLYPNADAGSFSVSWWNKSNSERFMIQRSTATAFTLDTVKQTAGGTFRPVLFRANDVPGIGVTEFFRMDPINLRTEYKSPILLSDIDIILSATTGTKIGTATTQKLGFYNKAPIVQPTAIASPANNVDALKTAVDAIRTALTNLGLTA